MTALQWLTNRQMAMISVDALRSLGTAGIARYPLIDITNAVLSRMLLGGPGPDGSDPGFMTQGAIFYEVRSVGQKSNGMLEQLFVRPSMAVLNAAADQQPLRAPRHGLGRAAVRRRACPAAAGRGSSRSDRLGRPTGARGGDRRRGHMPDETCAVDAVGRGPGLVTDLDARHCGGLSKSAGRQTPASLRQAGVFTRQDRARLEAGAADCELERLRVAAVAGAAAG